MIKLLTILAVAITLAGCYNQKKATVQHGRAVATYPEIGADYCARTYPPDTTFVPGDTTITFDTIRVGGEVHFDTVYSERRDTIRITKYIQGPHTIERQVIRDTIRQSDPAAVDAERIERRRVTVLLEQQTAEANKQRKRARIFLWILIVAGALIAARLYFKFRK